MQYNLPALKRQLVDYFNLNELRDLYFELDVDWDDVDGDETKSDRSRELLTYLKRRSRVPDLIQYCQQARPNADWNLIKSQRAQNEEFVTQIGLNPSISAKYLEAKFELYRTTWQSLHELRVAGDTLWQRASQENIRNFAALLKQTKTVIGINAILFDEQEHDELLSLLERFTHYSAGKSNLINSLDDRLYDNPDDYMHQVRLNGQNRQAYEALLDSICASFRGKLNAWAVH